MAGPSKNSLHIGEALHRLGEALNGLVGVAVLNAVPGTVLDMPLQHHLAAAVQRGLGSVDLGQYILAGHILVHHPVDGLNLADDFLQPPVQVLRVHTLLHVVHLPTLQDMPSLYDPAARMSTGVGRDGILRFRAPDPLLQ